MDEVVNVDDVEVVVIVVDDDVVVVGAVVVIGAGSGSLMHPDASMMNTINTVL